MKPQLCQMPPIPHGPQLPMSKGIMTNAEIRDALRLFTKLMMTQAQVVTNQVVDQAILGVVPHPQPNVSTSAF